VYFRVNFYVAEKTSTCYRIQWTTEEF